jgi:hypothetical protein
MTQANPPPTPVVDPIRDSRAKGLAARGAVCRNGDHFIVTPPSLADEPPSFKVWRDECGVVRCSCEDYGAANSAAFRCEHILAVKHFLLAKTITAHRAPDGSLAARPDSADDGEAAEYAKRRRAVRVTLVHAASIAASLLGEAPSPIATLRVGMPEVLLDALENCGDAEAARLAAETFLERMGARRAA